MAHLVAGADLGLGQLEPWLSAWSKTLLQYTITMCFSSPSLEVGRIRYSFLAQHREEAQHLVIHERGVCRTPRCSDPVPTLRSLNSAGHRRTSTPQGSWRTFSGQMGAATQWSVPAAACAGQHLISAFGCPCTPQPGCQAGGLLCLIAFVPYSCLPIVLTLDY